MAELDPKTATIREVAQAYATKNKRGDAFVTSSVQFFKNIADEPGSAMRLFEKDADGVTLLARTFKDSEDSSTVKTAMQNLRQVGLTLKGLYGPDTPEYNLLPDEKPNTELNKRIFGRAEPAKAVAAIGINPDRESMGALFSGVAKYLDDPKTRPIAQAIIFNLNTGLRPNAVGQLQISSYGSEKGSLFIDAETKGAKGRSVNIPLNPLADSILQSNLPNAKKTGFFFTKENGKPVTSEDMTKLLREVEVPKIMFDQNTKTYYDSLSPDNFKGKKGSALLRNIHATIGYSIGIPMERLAYLQGRSLKAASESAEQGTYLVNYPHAVGDVDRGHASMFSSFFADAAKEAGFDIGERMPLPTERVTTATPGYEGYFDLPVAEKVPEPAGVVDPNTEVPTINPEASSSLKDKGFDAKGAANAFTKFFKGGKNKLSTAVSIGAGGLTVASLIDDASAVVRDVAMEAGALAMKAPAGVAGAIPMMLAPTEVESGTLYTDEELREQEAARIVTEDAGMDMYSETDEREMERVVTRDTGFVNIDRVPEAASVDEGQGFLSR